MAKRDREEGACEQEAVRLVQALQEAAPASTPAGDKVKVWPVGFEKRWPGRP